MEKITFFEFLCLLYTGKYPERIIFNGNVYIRGKYDYYYCKNSLTSEIKELMALDGYLKEKSIEILDLGGLG